VGDGSMTVENGSFKRMVEWDSCTGPERSRELRRAGGIQNGEREQHAGFFYPDSIEPRERGCPVFLRVEVQIIIIPETSGEDEYHSTGMLYAFTKPLAIALETGATWKYMKYPGWQQDDRGAERCESNGLQGRRSRSSPQI